MRTALTWLGVLGTVPAFVASEVLPFAWFTPARLPHVLTQAELAFLLFLWPALLPRSLAQTNPGGEWLGDLRAVGVQALTLVALAAPFVALCARTAEMGWQPTLAMQAFPAGVALGVGLLAVASRRSGRDTSRLYYLTLLAVTAALPLAGFVLTDVGGGRMPWLTACSPFQAAVAGDAAAWATVGALVLAAAVCAAWPRRSS